MTQVKTAPVQQPQTKVVKTLDIKKDKVTKDGLTKEGIRLGSPISNMNEGEQRNVTLTGKIEIREYQGVKAAYMISKEGISIKVNASFDPAVHTEGAVVTIQCNVFTPENGTPRKFAALLN